MAVTQSSLRVIKEFAYRGNPTQRFSNRYYFDGSPPADTAAWTALFDAVNLIEKTIYDPRVKIVENLGFNPGSDVPVATKQVTIAGTGSFIGLQGVPGDCAAVLRMATTKRSKKNHPVYLFSYFHQAVQDQAVNQDVLHATQRNAIQLYGNDWLNGIVVSGRSYKRCTPDGHATTGATVNQYIGHRDFVN